MIRKECYRVKEKGVWNDGKHDLSRQEERNAGGISNTIKFIVWYVGDMHAGIIVKEVRKVHHPKKQEKISGPRSEAP